jgi:hypothetical protein
MAECEPGELAEIDFGRLGLVADPERGGRRVAWALVVILVHSRHQYVHITFSQKIADVIDGLSYDGVSDNPGAVHLASQA